jgi:hypothetical protein
MTLLTATRLDSGWSPQGEQHGEGVAMGKRYYSLMVRLNMGFIPSSSASVPMGHHRDRERTALRFHQSGFQDQGQDSED